MSRSFKLAGTYRIYLDPLRTPVILTVWLGPAHPGHERYYIRASHRLKIPGQMREYSPAMVVGQDDADPDKLAEWYTTRMLDSYLHEAIADGQTPSEDWLVPDDR